MDFDIVIVGAGLVGASFAVALRGAGLKLALVEAQAPVAAGEDWDSRVYAISPGSAAFLEGMGVWKRIDRSRIAAVREMQIYGDAAGAQLQFSAYESGVPELAWTVESKRLQNVLWQALEHQHNLELLCPEQCASLQVREDAVELALAGGNEDMLTLFIVDVAVTLRDFRGPCRSGCRMTLLCRSAVRPAA